MVLGGFDRGGSSVFHSRCLHVCDHTVNVDCADLCVCSTDNGHSASSSSPECPGKQYHALYKHFRFRLSLPEDIAYSLIMRHIILYLIISILQHDFIIRVIRFFSQ